MFAIFTTFFAASSRSSTTTIFSPQPSMSSRACSTFVPCSRSTIGRVSCIFDAAALLEFAEGDIANVFGPAYAAIDGYRRRVRLPMRDYLLVTRVTKMDAQLNCFAPCSMTTEYDVPVGGPLSEGGDGLGAQPTHNLSGAPWRSHDPIWGRPSPRTMGAFAI